MSVKARWLLASVASMCVVTLLAAAWFEGDPSAEPRPFFPDQTQVSTDGKTIEVSFITGSCEDHWDSEVAEDDQSVTITLEVTPSDANNCTAAGVIRQVVVHLEQPLGDRKILDGSIQGEIWQREDVPD